MKKSCLIAVIARLSICTAVRRSWTSTSVCCLARIRLRPLSLPQSSPQKILLPRMPQNKPNIEKRTRLVFFRLVGCVFS